MPVTATEDMYELCESEFNDDFFSEYTVVTDVLGDHHDDCVFELDDSRGESDPHNLMSFFENRY